MFVNDITGYTPIKFYRSVIYIVVVILSSYISVLENILKI